MYRLAVRVVMDHTDEPATLVDVATTETLHPPNQNSEALVIATEPVLERLIDDVRDRSREQLRQLAEGVARSEEETEQDAVKALGAVASLFERFGDDHHPQAAGACLQGIALILEEARERGTI